MEGCRACGVSGVHRGVDVSGVAVACVLLENAAVADAGFSRRLGRRLRPARDSVLGLLCVIESYGVVDALVLHCYAVTG